MMDKIEVTPEMRRRVLDNIERAELGAQKRGSAVRFPVRRLAALAACLALVLLGSLALPRLLGGERGTQGETVLLPNGFAVVEDGTRLSSAVGFEAEGIENLPFVPTETEYSYLDEPRMAQIIYRAEAGEIVWRKARGAQDISGDYNRYAAADTVTVGGSEVTLKGDGGGYRLALWTRDGFSYAISVTFDATAEELCRMIPAAP